MIERRICMIRGQKVMLDSDLAELYEVETKNLNLAVRRNLSRFPLDFMFQLTREEFENLKLQTVISTDLRLQSATSSSHGGRRYLPYVFTEHGVAMLSSVLKSSRAVQMNILIVRAFVHMRELIATNKDLSARMERMETMQKRHASVINYLADELEQLRYAPERPKRRIGFTS
jgi:hypothetical protein